MVLKITLLVQNLVRILAKILNSVRITEGKFWYDLPRVHYNLCRYRVIAGLFCLLYKYRYRQRITWRVHTVETQYLVWRQNNIHNYFEQFDQFGLSIRLSLKKML